MVQVVLLGDATSYQGASRVEGLAREWGVQPGHQVSVGTADEVWVTADHLADPGAVLDVRAARALGIPVYPV